MERDKERLLILIGIVLIIGGLIMLPKVAKARGVTGDFGKDWESIAEKYANMFGVPVELVKAIIMVESSGRPWVSRRENGYYSYGLMGITYPTARDMGFSGNPSKLFDPEVNVYYGVKYLRWLMDRPHIDGDIEKLAAAYNAGPDLRPWPSEYVEKVKYWMRRISA